MADQFTMNAAFYDWIVEGVSMAMQDEIGNAAFSGKQTSEGMYVKLTELGTVSGSADPMDPVPFKAIAVERQESDGLFVTTSDPITFDPDDVTGDANIILDYVYEINGNQDLVNTIQWITLHAYKAGDGDLYWGFDSGRQVIELALITADSSPGTYVGTQVDEDFVATGRLYDGNDLPILTCLQPGREHIPSGTYVHVLRKGEKALFFWKDPIVEMGPAGSPPADDNGDFDSFFDDAGNYGGNDYNYDAADGIYKHRRLIAIGAASGSSPGGVAAGLKITNIDDHNSKIEIVDANGVPVPPGGPSNSTCADLAYNRDTHVLTITTTDNNGVVCTNDVTLSTFCATPTFNNATRTLTVETKDDNGNVICAPTAVVPCCDGPTKQPTGGPGTPTERYPPTNYPPDTPVIITPTCTPPVVTCNPEDTLCYPVLKDTLMASVNVQTVNSTGDFSIQVAEVLDPEGNDIRAFFLGKRLDTEYWYNGGTDLKVGKYTFVFTVVNTSADPACVWPDYEVKCVREIVDCECNDTDSTDDGTGTDNCDIGSASYCDDYAIELGPNSCVLNVNRTAQDTGSTATGSVDLDLQYSPQLRGTTVLGQGPFEDPQINPTPVGNYYSKRVHFEFSKTWDADKSWGPKTFERPIILQKFGAAIVEDGKPATAKYNGRVILSYSAGANPPLTATFRAAFREGFSATTTPVAAKNGVPAIYEPKNAPDADGSFLVKLVVTPVNLDPDPNDLVGVVIMSSSCCAESRFEIVGGTDAALFYLVQKGDSAEIYVRKGQNTAKASYNLQIKGTCIDLGSDADDCTDTQSFNILLCKTLEQLTTTQTTGPGVAGDAVAALVAADGIGDLVAENGRPSTEWAIAAVSEVDTPLVKTTDPYFVIQPGLNGKSDIINNVDLPDGDYTVTVQVRNAQMKIDRKMIEQDVVITIDGTSTYVPSRFKGLT